MKETGRQKIKNMETDYKKIKDNNRPTGKGRKEWKHFEFLDKLTCKRAAVQPSTILESTQGSNGSGDVNFSQVNDEVDDAEHSLFDDDLIQVNDPTQLDDLTQVDDDQTYLSDG